MKDDHFGFGGVRTYVFLVGQSWIPGFLWSGGVRLGIGVLRGGCAHRGEALAVLLEVQERVAELAVERGLVAAEEFEAVDVVADLNLQGVSLFAGGRFSMGRTGEGLPCLDEVEVVVGGVFRVQGADALVIEAHLSVEQGGLGCDETGLTPTDVGELVDEGFFHVVLGVEGRAKTFEVELKDGLVFDAEDDVDGCGEPVFESIGAGLGLPFRGGGSTGFGSVDASLLGVSAFVGFGHGVL